MAIQVIGENLEKMPEQILTPVQNSLQQAMEVLTPFRGHQGGVNSVAISADGQTIVSGVVTALCGCGIPRSAFG
jgi:WD40 repeat protein